MDYFAQIIASPEGGTSSLKGQNLPAHGYFVGGLVSPLILPEGLVFAPDAAWDVAIFATYLTETAGADYIGWWTDEETGLVWVDGTTWHPSLDDATAVGRERSEIAIYDVEAQAEIRL